MKKRSPLGSTVEWAVGVSRWLFLNQDTWAAGLLYGGLQVTVTFSPLLTVRLVGCWTKRQSISRDTQCHLNVHVSFLCMCFSQFLRWTKSPEQVYFVSYFDSKGLQIFFMYLNDCLGFSLCVSILLCRTVSLKIKLFTLCKVPIYLSCLEEGYNGVLLWNPRNILRTTIKFEHVWHTDQLEEGRLTQTWLTHYGWMLHSDMSPHPPWSPFWKHSQK